MCIRDSPYTEPLRTAPLEAPAFASASLEQDLLTVLASGDVCSKRWIWEQYDHMVRTNTVSGPGADAAIVRIKETGSSVAMALDGNGRYCVLGPREGAKLAVAECCRNLSVAGAEPVAATNCLNFGNPERPEIMAQLVEAIEGMAEACEFFGTPITGGNVSLYNETLGEGIYPTPVIGIVGLMKTAAPAGIDFKRAGASVVLLGGAGEADEQRFGGTAWVKAVLGGLWGLPPALDMDRERRVQAAAREIVLAGLAESAHDVSDGGLAVALAESAFGPARIGARIDLASDLRPELLLFHEGPSRVVISTAAPEKVAEIAARHGVEAPVVGVTMEGELEILQNGTRLAAWKTEALHSTWGASLERHVR